MRNTLKNLARLGLVLGLLLAVTAVLAADDEGNPNDPTENDRANACYEGGSLEGKCDQTDMDRDGTVEDWEIEAMWECGWYLIRYEYALIPRDTVPGTCTPALPPEPTPGPSLSTPEPEETPEFFGEVLG